MNNPNISTFIQDEPSTMTNEESNSWIERHQNDFTFSMINKNTEELIGNCSLHDIKNSTATLGILIGEKFQNQGLGTEALTFLIRYSFQILNLKEIRLIVFSHNERAIHVYQNLGFREYNRITAVTTRNNKPIDDIYMRLTR